VPDGSGDSIELHADDGGDLTAASGVEEGVEGWPAAAATGHALVDELDGWNAAYLSVGPEAV